MKKETNKTLLYFISRMISIAMLLPLYLTYTCMYL